MIKEMKYKFILVTFFSMLIIVIMLLGTIYTMVSYSNQRQVYKLMDNVLKSNGKALIDTGEKVKFRVSHKTREEFLDSTFAVQLDHDKNIVKLIGNSNTAYTAKTIAPLVSESLLKENKRGNTGELKYVVEKKDYGYLIVYSDYSEQNFFLNNLLKICMIVGTLGCLLIGILIIKLSYWVVGPAEKALENQKVFISNASHELRTPLTIISANFELIENEMEDNKRLRTIKFQINRMNSLVNDLLNVSRLENKKKPSFAAFNLSKVIMNTALSLESIAYEANKVLTLDIKEDIVYYGESEKMKELTSILLDNAIKYSNAGGTIKLSLQRKNRHPVLEVFNTGNTIPKEEADKIFARFYRGKSYDGRKLPGFGLGLSIAEAIIKMHHGRIYFENIRGIGVKFIVKL